MNNYLIDEKPTRRWAFLLVVKRRFNETPSPLPSPLKGEEKGGGERRFNGAEMVDDIKKLSPLR